MNKICFPAVWTHPLSKALTKPFIKTPLAEVLTTALSDMRLLKDLHTYLAQVILGWIRYQQVRRVIDDTFITRLLVAGLRDGAGAREGRRRKGTSIALFLSSSHTGS
jgi:hypothetical protein